MWAMASVRVKRSSDRIWGRFASWEDRWTPRGFKGRIVLQMTAGRTWWIRDRWAYILSDRIGRRVTANRENELKKSAYHGYISSAGQTIEHLWQDWQSIETGRAIKFRALNVRYFNACVLRPQKLVLHVCGSETWLSYVSMQQAKLDEEQREILTFCHNIEGVRNISRWATSKSHGRTLDCINLVTYTDVQTTHARWNCYSDVATRKKLIKWAPIDEV